MTIGTRAARSMKRAVDVVVAASALVVLSPVMVLIAVVVASTSHGRPFYLGKRVGRRGKPFRIVKFRTMRNNDDSGFGVTVGGDPRVTPLGAFLRRYKLDELPQLLNVLVGHMSLVGPRPEDPIYVASYSPSQRTLLSVRPGITSPASIAFSSEEDVLAGFDDAERAYREVVLPAKCRLDASYLEGWRLRDDFGIILKTMRIILGHRDHALANSSEPVDGKLIEKNPAAQDNAA